MKTDWNIIACPNKDCNRYQARMYSGKYCAFCSATMREVVRCCDQEELHDKGFCRFCGRKKELMFAEIPIVAQDGSCGGGAD